MTESQSRLARLRELMAAQQVDLLAVGPTPNMRYLLGFTPFADERLCLLLLTQRDVQVVVPGLNADKVAEGTDLPLITWADEEGPQQALAGALARTAPGVRRLAFDGAMRADFLLPLLGQLTHLAPAGVVPAGALLGTLRQCKTPDEVAALQAAASQADRAMQAAVDACHIGATEAEIAWATEAAFRLDGAETVDFTLVASGPHGAFPHHLAGERRLQPGDGVILDIGATLNGYHSDITRMVHMGRPSDEFSQAYAAVLAANTAGRAAVRPGVTAGDVDRATREVLEQLGYGPYFIHRTGHGIGLEEHEPPWIRAGDPMVLESGMAFSIEPGVYLPGRFGIRIEDIVVVTSDGAQVLTGFDHALVIRD